MKTKYTAVQAELGQEGDPLLDIEGAAHMLGTTVRHLRRLRSENRIPYTKVGGKLRFRCSDLVGFIEANSHAVVSCSTRELGR